MNNSRDPLGLGSLAQPRPLVDGWPVIEAALMKRQSVRNHLPWAAAALLALAVGLYFQLRAPHPPGGVAQAVKQKTAAPGATAQQPGAGAEGNTLAELVVLSQELESSLRRARARVVVMPAQSLVYLVELEDLVAQVDEAINQSPESFALWSQRVNLLLDLNQIYQRELRRDYSTVASL
jgi:hypothetical protein